MRGDIIDSDGWYEDDDEVRFVVTVRRRPGRRLSSDVGVIRGAIISAAIGGDRPGTTNKPRTKKDTDLNIKVSGGYGRVH
jgi:hypothetical protein